MRSRLRQLVLLPTVIFGMEGDRALTNPAPTGVGPASVTPGQDIVVTGTDLVHSGLIAELQYSKKYRATAGESPTGLVTATSQTATRLVFPAPPNMQPTGLALRYHSNTKTATFTALTNDTSLASHSPFPIPGRVDVKEAPLDFTSGMGVWVGTGPSGQLVSGPFIAPGTVTVTGRNLVAGVGGATTVTFNGAVVPQATAPRYDPTGNEGRGIDIVTLQVSEPSVSVVGDLTVTTAAGSNTRTNVLMMRRPRVTVVEEINTSGTVIGPSGGRLVRGHRYQIRGTDLASPGNPPVLMTSDVRLAGTSLRTSDTTIDASHMRFVVPTTLIASGGLLEVVPTAGTPASAGTFAISDAGAVPPPLSDVVVAPSSAVWGSVLSATVAFAGSITAGSDVGSVEVTSPTPGDFAGLPMTVPITANPQTIAISSRVRSTAALRTIRFRLTRTTGIKDSIDRSVQFVAPSLTGLTIPVAAVGGGSFTTAKASFDFASGVGTSCGNVLLSGPDLRFDVTSSDTSIAQIDNRILGSSTGVCVTSNNTDVEIQTRPVTGPRTVTITAQLREVTKTLTLTVRPPTLTSIKANRASLASMQSATGTLTMDAPAPNAPVLLSTSDPSVSVPAKIVLSSGTSASFPITTLPVSSTRTVTISAAVNGATQSTTITLNPLQIAGVVASPSAVRGGTNAAGSVSLSATIDLPFTVALSSSDPNVATVPPTLSFVAGQSAAVFNVQTVGPQSTQKVVTITATYSVTLPNGSVVTTSQTGTITVTP